MPARTSRTLEVVPEIAAAAQFATDLVTRTLKLVAQGIAAEELSPSPDVKKCAAYVATIKRAADALKSLAPLRSAPAPTAATPVPQNVPLSAAPSEPSASKPTETLNTLPDDPIMPSLPEPAPTEVPPPSSKSPSIASSLASLAKLRGKSLRPPATTRSYGEHFRRS